MAIQKKVNGTWQSINPKQLKGIPYTGTLPAVLAETKAGYLHKYKIYGNLEQTGTPTPENPIYPSECGERTGNLFDEQYPDIMPSTITYKPLQVGSGFFTLSTTTPIYSTSALLFFLPGIATSGASLSNNVYDGVSRTVESINGYVTIGYRIMSQDSPANYKTMLNLGSTTLPYEPYGYKLPLLSGSTPVDIYIGESQTTRRIKKLVLTGEEGWVRAQTKRYYINASTGCPTDYLKQTITTSICSHYQSQNNTASGSNEVQVGHFCFYTGGSFELYIGETTISSAADFKTYLQQQYANGTPVTIWYVLGEPETGTLNEPLRKIGDYVDAIDSTQTTAQIPTTANSTTISWGGQGLAPSEFDSIQEWVDIPTYKRVNGEWVADN